MLCISAPTISREGFCRSPRGLFLNKVLGEFRGGFFCGSFRAFFLWKKNKRKKSTPKSTAKLKSEFGTRPKSTLQGSGLETFILPQLCRVGDVPLKFLHRCIESSCSRPPSPMVKFLGPARSKASFHNGCFFLGLATIMSIDWGRKRKKYIKNTNMKNRRGPQHRDLRAQILYVGGGVPHLLYFFRRRTPT